MTSVAQKPWRGQCMNPKAARTPHLIALANEPRMLREMLHRALDNTPGVIVVEQTGDLQRLTEIFRQVQIDWLVVTLDDEARIPRQAFLLLNRIAPLSLLAISMDGSRIIVHLKTLERGVRKYLLEEIPLATLIAILRYKCGDQQLPSVLATAQMEPGLDHWRFKPEETETNGPPRWRHGRVDADDEDEQIQ
jgi:DNA-binding NarL/FixJ family response regulator